MIIVTDLAPQTGVLCRQRSRLLFPWLCPMRDPVFITKLRSCTGRRGCCPCRSSALHMCRMREVDKRSRDRSGRRQFWLPPIVSDWSFCQECNTTHDHGVVVLAVGRAEAEAAAGTVLHYVCCPCCCEASVPLSPLSSLFAGTDSRSGDDGLQAEQGGLRQAEQHDAVLQ